jgi:hypothetical protein
MTKAPNLRNTFSNARLNNNITPDLESEQISSLDASYIIKTPKLKARLTTYFAQIENSTKISFFYGEGISDADGDPTTDNEDAFISEIITGINKRNVGAELGLEYQITSTIKLSAAASYGQYIFSNNPNLKINDDALATATNSQPIIDFGKTYLKNYRVAGSPQQAYSVGLEYRDPKFWWIGANANYLADTFLDVSSILRTNNFTIDPTTEISYAGVTEQSVRKVLRQEKFDPYTLINITGGKSWRIKNDTFGIFASLNNVFDIEYKTGGFEQSRKATYPFLQEDLVSGNNLRSFGPKYFYGFGRTFFVNLYLNF